MRKWFGLWVVQCHESVLTFFEQSCPQIDPYFDSIEAERKSRRQLPVCKYYYFFLQFPFLLIHSECTSRDGWKWSVKKCNKEIAYSTWVQTVIEFKVEILFLFFFLKTELCTMSEDIFGRVHSRLIQKNMIAPFDAPKHKLHEPCDMSQKKIIAI